MSKAALDLRAYTPPPEPPPLVPVVAPEQAGGVSRAAMLSHASGVWDRTMRSLRALQKGERNSGLFAKVARLAGYIEAPWAAWDEGTIRTAVDEVIQTWDPAAYQLHTGTLERALLCTEPAEVPGALGLFQDLRDHADRELENRRPVLRNFSMGIDGKTKAPRGLPDIVAEVREATEDWPRLAGDSLFALHGDRVQYLTRDAAFSAWIQGAFDLRWVGTIGGCKAPTLAELRAAIELTAPRYEGVSELPHEPPLSTVYYTRPAPVAGSGAALRAYLDLLNPETELDALLLEAALLTPLWGGPPGARPAFVLTSQHGRGVGKSATAWALSEPYGGHLAMRQGESGRDLTDRLLTDGADAYRIVYLDNLKGRVDSGDVEALITAPMINGRKMYRGDARRPNFLTWMLSSNQASLSADLASRAVVIEIGPRRWGADFYGAARALLADRGAELLADMVGRLRGPLGEPGEIGRFGAWQREVLGRLPRGPELAGLIHSRASGADDDAAEAEDVAAAIEQWLGTQGQTDYTGPISVPDLLVATSGIWGDIRTARGLWRRLGPLLGSGPLAACYRLTGGRAGRGLYWESQQPCEDAPF